MEFVPSVFLVIKFNVILLISSSFEKTLLLKCVIYIDYASLGGHFRRYCEIKRVFYNLEIVIPPSIPMTCPVE